MGKARCRLHVAFPDPQGTVNGVPYTDPDTSTPALFVSAYGRARGLIRLAACLLAHEDGKAYPGTPLQAGMHWIFGFPKLPQKKGKKYFLLVGTTDADKAANTTAVVEFTIDFAGAFADGDIPVQTPQAGDSVCPQFTAYGSLVNNMPTTKATLGPAVGRPVDSGVSGIWMYQFTDVPEGSGYLFYVTDGPHKGEHKDITVDSTVCGSGSAPPVGSGPLPSP